MGKRVRIPKKALNYDEIAPLPLTKDYDRLVIEYKKLYQENKKLKERVVKFTAMVQTNDHSM